MSSVSKVKLRSMVYAEADGAYGEERIGRLLWFLFVRTGHGSRDTMMGSCKEEDVHE